MLLLVLSRSLKKAKSELSADRKELQSAKHAFELEKAALAAATTAHNDKERLMKQIILALVQRLRLQLELLSVVPPEIRAAHDAKGPSSASRNLRGSTLNELLQQFQHHNVDKWRGMYSKWERLQQELDDADWRLVHMKDRLEELCLADPQTITSHNVRSQPAASGGALSSTSPFSDAIAAGKETVPVAEQLKTSASARSLAQHSGPPVAAPVEDDKVAKLASALAKGG